MTQVTRRELFPGVWLRTVHTDKFKSSYLSLTMLVPLDRERAAANALLFPVLRRGTREHPDMESLSAALDELYGGAIEPIVRKKGETQCLGFVASFLDDAFAPGGEPLLEPAAGLLGDVEHAAAVTPGSLWERYQQLLSTAQIELYYCGSAEEERVARALKEALSALPVNEGRICPDCEVRLHAGPEPSMVEESMDVTQGKLAMGFRTGGVTCWEEEYPAMAMCNAVFGGTTLSKLFMNVREKLSLCYYASSTLEKMKGLILVSSGIEFDKFQQARDEILYQLEEIRQGNMEDWELEGTRRTMIGAHLATLDVQDRQEDFWLGQTAAGLETGIEELVAQLEQVTREQVAQAAQKLELDTIYFLKGTEG